MARDGSGNYILPAGQPVSTGTTIDSAVHNTLANDLAVALTNSLSKDGQTTASANLPMGTFRHTAVGAATARDQYGQVAQLQDSAIWTLTTVSGADTITANLSPAIASYATGLRVQFKPVSDNTGAVTLALNGLSAKAVVKGSTGAALAAGDLKTDVPATLIYNGTSFYLQNPTVPANVALLNAANVFTANQRVTSTAPSLELEESDSGADAKIWRMESFGSAWVLRTRTDVGGAGATAISVARTGTTVSSIALTATAITLNGVAITDVPLLTAANTFAANITIGSTAPAYVLIETDASANEGHWRTVASGAQLFMQTRNDADSGGSSYITVSRSGVTVTQIDIAGTAVRVNGTNVNNAGLITTGTFADAVVAESNVTQHQAALVIAGDQITTAVSTKTADYAVLAADAEDIIRMNSGSATNVTLNSGTLAIGESVAIVRLGLGTVTFVAGAGQTINSPAGLLDIAVRYGTVVATYHATNTWLLSGNLG